MLIDQWGWLNIYADVAYSNGYRGNSSTIVAVIDTGIDLDHPDLVANIYTNAVEAAGSDGVDDDSNGFIDDIHGWNFVDNNNDTGDHAGHGSHVAGIIAADNNGIGIVGIAPDVKILPIKVIESVSGDMSVLDEAIYYATNMGAHIISMSIGTDSAGPFPDINANLTAAYASGIVLVAAAGNDATSPVNYPASHSDVIAVSAVDKSNAFCSLYSNYGMDVEISAPGGYSPQILSTGNVSDYIYKVGTSMACPHVTGVIALMLQKNSSMTPDDIRQKMADTAIDLGTPGWDAYYGEGLINAAGCLDLPMEHTYNVIWGWIFANIYWVAPLALGIVLLIIYYALRKPKAAETSYYPSSETDSYTY